jgi:hypothetical protein
MFFKIQLPSPFSSHSFLESNSTIIAGVRIENEARKLHVFWLAGKECIITRWEDANVIVRRPQYKFYSSAALSFLTCSRKPYCPGLKSMRGAYDGSRLSNGFQTSNTRHNGHMVENHFEQTYWKGFSYAYLFLEWKVA